MNVLSTSVLPVAAVRWMSSSGVPALTVVCRATFALQPIVSRLAEEQDPIAVSDTYWNNDPRRSLQAASDLVPYKARAEVLLVGHAYAPQGRPARSVVARLAVGTIDKRVEVMPDRRLGRDGAIREGAPWTRRPLWYEATAIGAARVNPAGMGFDAEDPSGAVTLPSLQPPGARVARRGDTFEPACFGPIAPAWPQRSTFAPWLGARWASAIAEDRPLPDGVEPAFFNCAPLDQQLDVIRPDERILLEHLHPKHTRVLTSLPGIAPRAEVERLGRPPAPLALTCDTMWIDTDRGTCSLVFRGTIPLAYAGEPGCVTVHLDLPDDVHDAGVDRTMATPFKEGLTASMPFAVAEPSADTGSFRATGSTAALPFQAMPPVPAPPPLVTAVPAPPPLVTAPPDATPWAASTGSATSPMGSIGQRLAMDQSLAETDAARPARPPAEVPFVGPLAAEAPPAEAPAEPADAGAAPGSSSDAGEPTEDGLSTVEAAPVLGGREILLNVYSEPGLLDALRRDPRWRERLDAIEADGAGEDAPLSRLDEEDPGLLVSLLARAEPSPPRSLRAALAAGVRADGGLTCPLAVVEGVLSCSFDERERLRVLASTALAIDPDDEALARPIAAARAALSEASLPGAVARRLEGAVRAAFGAKERAMPARELASVVERALVEQRAYARREVLDGTHVRAEIACGEEAPIVVYVPDAHARALPLARRMRARLLVEVRPQEDEREACPIALRARAMARFHSIPTE